MTSRSLADRIKAEPERVRGGRVRDGDLVEQFAVRAEDEERGRPWGPAWVLKPNVET